MLPAVAVQSCVRTPHQGWSGWSGTPVTTGSCWPSCSPPLRLKPCSRPQMIGAQRVAMTFLASSLIEGQSVEAVDSHILRATRLMRLFNEQVETMAKLKGKGSQQRVVVEHVTVAAGGQAIVGTVIPGGRGRTGGDNDRQ